MEDQRLIAISDLLAQYSIGNFDTEEIKLSENLDEIDTIISGVNMLGEELEATTVSRDFFANIYNTVSNILIVCNNNLEITDVNDASIALLQYDSDEFTKLNLDQLIHELQVCDVKIWMDSESLHYHGEVDFLRKDRALLPTDLHVSRLYNPDESPNGFLIIAQDLTDKKLKEREILLNIMETQEQERRRVADDLHDSLGQELSGIRMMLATITNQVKDNDKAHNNLNSVIDLLDSSLQNIRSICFDLVPSALTEGELVVAMRQVIRKMDNQDNIKYTFESNLDATSIDKQRQVAVYRVFQEFIHNAVKHANCSAISVQIEESDSEFRMSVRDNGVGFNIEKGKEFTGRGLSTMNSRIKALGGAMELKSALGNGTAIKIIFKI